MSIITPDTYTFPRTYFYYSCTTFLLNKVNPKTRTFHPNSLRTHLHLKDHAGQKSQKMSHSKLIFEVKIHVFSLKMVLKSFRWSRNYPQKSLKMKTFQMVLKSKNGLKSPKIDLIIWTCSLRSQNVVKWDFLSDF